MDRHREMETDTVHRPVTTLLASSCCRWTDTETDADRQRQTLSTGLSLHLWPAAAADGPTLRDRHREIKTDIVHRPVTTFMANSCCRWTDT